MGYPAILYVSEGKRGWLSKLFFRDNARVDGGRVWGNVI
jgi:hypothetical protein